MRSRYLRVLGLALLAALTLASQDTVRAAFQNTGMTVTGNVTLVNAAPSADKSDTVVWLSPTADNPQERSGGTRRFRILQQGKRFQPHLQVVPVGSTVDFPNLDPILHNVFSLFDGKRFDLGLYESGASRGVNFTRTGVCYVFCNIHPEMSAVVVVVDTPYYAASNAAGAISIADVPPGRYALSVWHERFKPENAAEYPKTVTISAGAATIGSVRMVEASRVPVPHKNKFGHDYTPAGSTSPIYP